MRGEKSALRHIQRGHRADGAAHSLSCLSCPRTELSGSRFFHLEAGLDRLDNYADVLAMPEFWNALGRGLLFSGATITLQIVLGIGFRNAARCGHPSQASGQGIAVLPYLLPTIIVALTFQWMLDSTVGVFTQFVRLFGYSYIPWGEKRRRGNDRRHRAQRVDLDTFRDPGLPGRIAGGAGRTL